MRGLIVLTVFISSLSHAAIFGADDRQPITSEIPRASQLVQATAIAVLTGNQRTDPQTGLIDINASPDSLLCADQRFAQDPHMTYECTGFLVAPDLLVTAGHCVYAVNTPNKELINEKGLACKAFDWLFDYEQRPDGTTQTTAISPSRMYHCAKIIYATQKESAPYDDYALIQLDRPAFGRIPFAIAKAPVSVGDSVASIGYPLGSPAKFSRNAKVKLNDQTRTSFLTNIDALLGNSGGPVFDARNQVVGILVGGTPMFDTVDAGHCSRVNHCNDDGSVCDVPDGAATIAQLKGYQGVGTEVMRIAPIIELLKTLAARH